MRVRGADDVLISLRTTLVSAQGGASSPVRGASISPPSRYIAIAIAIAIAISSSSSNIYSRLSRYVLCMPIKGERVMLVYHVVRAQMWSARVGSD